MLTVCYALVGVTGSVFAVDIDESKLVGHLKTAIKEQNKAAIQCDAAELELWFATVLTKVGGKEKRSWLPAAGPVARALAKGVCPQDPNDPVKKYIDATTAQERALNATFKIQKLIAMNEMPALESEQIHVLVKIVPRLATAVVPHKRLREQATAGDEPLLKRGLFALKPTFQELLQRAKTKGRLPEKNVSQEEGATIFNLFDWTEKDRKSVAAIDAICDIVGFTGAGFYIREEILQVLRLVKTRYRANLDGGPKNERSEKQFILVGGPGTGKSCILALLCFYIAIEKNMPVVWSRQVADGVRLPTTRLFYKGSYYEWDDPDAAVYKSLYKAVGDVSLDPVDDCWFCLDGFPQDDLRHKVLSNAYRMLAMSGQFDVKSESADLLVLCLVPYWRQEDLEDLGSKLKNYTPDEAAERYFISGGNLSEFINDTARANATMAIKCVKESGVADSLLLSFLAYSDEHVNCIRMIGVVDISNIDDYLDPFKRRTCVTSPFVLRRLAVSMKPDFFAVLITFARQMRDNYLEEVAFKARIHCQVYRQRSLCFQWSCLENENVASQGQRGNLFSEADCIKCDSLSLIECKGENEEEVISLMKSWAASPCELDY